MKWITSAGGPLILLGERDLPLWGGCLGPGAKTDYHRACEVPDYIGVVSIGSHQGLVFGDEPMATAWVPMRTSKGCLFIRWQYAEDEISAIQHSNKVPNSAFETMGVLFQVEEPRLYLFDSAVAGSSLKDLMKEDEIQIVTLACGTYVIETAQYQPDRDTALIIHRLTPSYPQVRIKPV